MKMNNECGCLLCLLGNSEIEPDAKDNPSTIPLQLISKWRDTNLSYGFKNVPLKTENQFHDAFDELNKYSNFRTNEVNYNVADIQIEMKKTPSNYLAGAFYPPNGYIILSERFANNWSKGAYRDTVYHEIGHAIGYAHTFEHKELLPFPEADSRRWSVMAYKNRREAKTFQALDIESFRDTYGTKLANIGNDTYELKDLTGQLIVDDGGKDTIDFRGTSESFAMDAIQQLNKDEHLLLTKGNAKDWVSVYKDTTFEIAIMPNGEKVLLDGSMPLPTNEGNTSVLTVDDLTNFKKRVNLKGKIDFEKPLIFAGALSDNDPSPAIPTIESVTKNGFVTDIEKPRYLGDDTHPKESVDFLIAEQGQFDNYVAGTTTIVDLNRPMPLPDELLDYKYVVMQVQNQRDFYVTRQDTEKDIFTVQTEEAYSAINTKPIEVAYLGTDDLKVIGGINQMQSINGFDTAWLREGANGLFIQEEQSLDRETHHVKETFL